MTERYDGPCVCGGKRGWFEGEYGDTYCSCDAGKQCRDRDNGVAAVTSREQAASLGADILAAWDDQVRWVSAPPLTINGVPCVVGDKLVFTRRGLFRIEVPREVAQ